MAPAILIIDDDAGFRRVARDLLLGRGYAVAGEAATVKDGRAAVGREGPDGILLDVNLPDGDGLELAAELCAAEPAMRVLLTSTNDEAVPARAVEHSGAAGFVRKRDLVSANLAGYFDTSAEDSAD